MKLGPVIQLNDYRVFAVEIQLDNKITSMRGFKQRIERRLISFVYRSMVDLIESGSRTLPLANCFAVGADNSRIQLIFKLGDSDRAALHRDNNMAAFEQRFIACVILAVDGDLL